MVDVDEMVETLLPLDVIYVSMFSTHVTLDKNLFYENS